MNVKVFLKKEKKKNQQLLSDTLDFKDLETQNLVFGTHQVFHPRRQRCMESFHYPAATPRLRQAQGSRGFRSSSHLQLWGRSPTPCPQRTAAGQGLRRLCRAPERAPRWEPQPEASEGQHWHYTQWLRRLGCHGAAPEPEEAASPSPSPVPVPHPVRSPPHCTLDSIAHPGSGVARGSPRPAREGMAW